MHCNDTEPLPACLSVRKWSNASAEGTLSFRKPIVKNKCTHDAVCLRDCCRPKWCYTGSRNTSICLRGNKGWRDNNPPVCQCFSFYVIDHSRSTASVVWYGLGLWAVKPQYTWDLLGEIRYTSLLQLHPASLQITKRASWHDKLLTSHIPDNLAWENWTYASSVLHWD